MNNVLKPFRSVGTWTASIDRESNFTVSSDLDWCLYGFLGPDQSGHEVVEVGWIEVADCNDAWSCVVAVCRVKPARLRGSVVTIGLLARCEGEVVQENQDAAQPVGDGINRRNFLGCMAWAGTGLRYSFMGLLHIRDFALVENRYLCKPYAPMARCMSRTYQSSS